MRRGCGCLVFLAILAALGYFLLPTRLTVTREKALKAGEQLLTRKKVVVFTAHPDDAEWWLSGTAARLAKAGARLRLVVASDGERGRNLLGGGDLAQMRRQEQRDAAKILGYAEVSFLGLPDRGIVDSDSLRSSVEKVIAQEQPEAILCFDGFRPALPYLHTDHESLGRIVERAWRASGSHALLYRFHTRLANVAVDTSSAIDLKLAAMKAHKSQIGSGRDGSIRRANSSTGSRVGVRYAEFFRVSEPER